MPSDSQRDRVGQNNRTSVEEITGRKVYVEECPGCAYRGVAQPFHKRTFRWFGPRQTWCLYLGLEGAWLAGWVFDRELIDRD